MMILQKRGSGILLHLTSLPGKYGIGDMGRSSLNFIDFLVKAGQTYWQILPLNPISAVFGNSPYMSFSAFAGNPLLISPDLLYEEGLLEAKDLQSVGSEYVVEFDQVSAFKKELLHKAFTNFSTSTYSTSFIQFCSQTPWLEDYALFMALKKKFGQKPWYEWPQEFRFRDVQVIEQAQKDLANQIDYYCFEQFQFSKQWQMVKEYAAEKSIRLIGDLPIYVGLDSVDVWANQKIFDLNPKTGRPETIAGVPPDYFSKTGQRWGNPLYRWNNPDVQKQLYDWWQARLSATFSLVNMIRIDHFRGFESYWSIPASEKTAINGKWIHAPGKTFFKAMKKALGSLPILAEDLGLITPEVEKLRDELGFPGMKVLLFGFDGNPDNTHLPHNHSADCIVYSGTHDNDTAVGWFLSNDVSPDAKIQIKKYANKDSQDQTSIHHDIIHLALASPAVLSILPMQDILGFGNDCRMNTPGTERGNWVWRCAERFFEDGIALQLHEKTYFFGRLPNH